MSTFEKNYQVQPTKVERVRSGIRKLFSGEEPRVDTSNTMLVLDDEARSQMTPECARLLEAFYLPETAEEHFDQVKYELSGKETRPQTVVVY